MRAASLVFGRYRKFSRYYREKWGEYRRFRKTTYILNNSYIDKTFTMCYNLVTLIVGARYI